MRRFGFVFALRFWIVFWIVALFIGLLPLPPVAELVILVGFLTHIAWFVMGCFHRIAQRVALARTEKFEEQEHRWQRRPRERRSGSTCRPEPAAITPNGESKEAYLVTTEYQTMSGSVVRDVVESPERSVNHGPKASAEMPPRGACDASVSRFQPSAEELTWPQRWQPSGYVNPYRLPPYSAADIYEELTAVDCWPNESNELARHTLINIVFLLFGVIVMSVFITLYAVAAAHGA